MKFLANSGEGHAVEVRSGGLVETLDGFRKRFAAELECLVMNGDEKLGSGIIAHSPCLLRRAVVVNPGIVRADRHNGQIIRPGRAEVPKQAGIGGVAAE